MWNFISMNYILKKRLFHLLLMSLFLMVPGISSSETPFKLNTSIKPPFSTQSQNGFIDVLAKELFSRLNISMEIVRLPAERAMANVNSGLSDGELPRVDGLAKKYQNIIQVPEKIIEYAFVAFSQPQKLETISFDNIKAKRVGLVIGWKVYEKNTVDYINLIKVSRPSQLFKMLNIDRLDIALYERYAGQYILKSQGFKNIHECTPPLVTKPMYLYVNKKHQSQIPNILEALKSIKTDGTYQKIVFETLGMPKMKGT
jgi:polar amino acid transport system substrate-binding protein